ncbi:MAG: Biopolymer transport protein ExbD [Syntrophorhabdaceae bacterium PtaU1.Bin034]|jgi:biopolymer transport protein ExbD|nr:MAG: Biopolymer transport protein ExbD [Syntrophorhabdaceae bacterium PtaU1.Bin034]
MEEKGFDYMNVIPLVDVMMVLLTIVLMTSTFIASGLIPIDVPKASRDQKQLVKTVTIAIDGKGIVYLESVPTTLAGLGAKIDSLGRETPVLIKADRHLAVQTCVDVLDVLSMRGFKKVALQTEQRSG